MRVCVCAYMCKAAKGSQKGVSSPVELESQVTVSCPWVLETELALCQSSGGSIVRPPTLHSLHGLKFSTVELNDPSGTDDEDNITHCAIR